MVKIYCNRCKKELDRNNKIGYIALNYRKSYLGDLVGDNQYEDMDFCTECMDDLKAFLAGPPAEHLEKHDEGTETVSEQEEIVSKQPETVSEQQGSETNQLKELFREPKDGTMNRKPKRPGRDLIMARSWPFTMRAGQIRR